MNPEDIKNKNLSKMIDLILNYPEEEIPSSIIGIMEVELLVSTVICPGVEEGLQLMSGNDDDELFIPAFTTLKKYDEFFTNNEFEPVSVKFNDFLDYLDEDIIGVTINPASDNFFISIDHLRQIVPISYPDFNMSQKTKEEFKALLKNTDDTALMKDIRGNDYLMGREEYESDEFNRFLYTFNNKVLFLMYASKRKLKRKKDNIYRTNKIKDLGYYSVIKDGSSYALIFTDEKLADIEYSHEGMDMNFFIQPVSLARITQDVLEMDLDGIIINNCCDNIVLTRELLLNEIDRINLCAHNPELDSYMDFLLKI